MKSNQKSLARALFSLRLGVFIVMFMWTLDKFINPAHTGKVFAKYYMFDGLSLGLTYVIAVLQMLLVFSFLLGVKKRWSYGAILLMHTVSTLSTYMMYLNPWGPKNLLFFAAWPMLAAIFSLYILREDDTLFTLKRLA